MMRASIGARIDVENARPAHLLELAGDTTGAIASYENAANGTASAPEKHYLVTRAARLASGYPPPP
jgi:hypothetical protein